MDIYSFLEEEEEVDEEDQNKLNIKKKKCIIM